MRNNTSIRNSKNTKTQDKVYPLVMRKDLYQELENTAYANDVSVAHFVREAVKRNLAIYKKVALV